MTDLLASLFVSKSKPQAGAGGVVAAPAPGAEGTFAEALVAFRAAATSQAPAPAGTPPQGSIPVTASGTVFAMKDMLPELLANGQIYKLGPDGEFVPLTEQEANELLKSVGLPPLPTKAGAGADAAPAEGAAPEDETPAGAAVTADTAPDMPAADAVIAGAAVPPPANAATPSPPSSGERAMSAATTPTGPALPDVPELPGTVLPDAATNPDADMDMDAATAPPVLREGRAATAGPPPFMADVPEAPVIAQSQIAAVAPRAAAPSDAATPSAVPQQAQQGTPAPAASTPPGAPVPAAAQQIAATPHVVSVQGATAATAADGPDAPPLSTPSPAVSTAPPPATPGATAQSAVPAAPAEALLNPQVAPDEPLPVPPAVETEAKAADPALAVLTKDKPDAKPVAPPPQLPADAAPQDAEAAGVKPTTVEPAEPAKRDAPSEPAPADKTVKADKPAAPEPRAPQQQTQPPQPLPADRPVMTDAAQRAVQQQMQSLPATAIPQIAGEMAVRVKQGATRFEIRLDPPELGRVDVRIEVDADGHVHSRLTVEKSETLDLLKADQRVLERALNEAGFKSDQGSLSFTLKDNGGNGQQKFDDQRFLREQAAASLQTEEEPARLTADLAYRAPMGGTGGLDLRV